MGIYVKFIKTTHKIWSCHVTLASNSENFYFSPNFVLNLGKVTRLGVNWLKNKKLQAKNKLVSGKHLLPQLKISRNLFSCLFEMPMLFLVEGHNSCLSSALNGYVTLSYQLSYTMRKSFLPSYFPSITCFVSKG